MLSVFVQLLFMFDELIVIAIHSVCTHASCYCTDCSPEAYCSTQLHIASDAVGLTNPRIHYHLRIKPYVDQYKMMPFPEAGTNLLQEQSSERKHLIKFDPHKSNTGSNSLQNT